MKKIIDTSGLRKMSNFCQMTNVRNKQECMEIIILSSTDLFSFEFD
jgi:hypothetical protein